MVEREKADGKLANKKKKFNIINLNLDYSRLFTIGGKNLMRKCVKEKHHTCPRLGKDLLIMYSVYIFINICIKVI